MCVETSVPYFPLTKVLQNLVRAAPDDALLAVHDSAHQSIFGRHESLLQEKGFVVPSDDATPKLVALPYAQSPAVANGGGTNDHRSPECSQCLEHAVAHVEREAGKVTLTEVTSVVHVAHVDVMGCDPAGQGLHCRDVPNCGLEPGPQDHNGRPQEVPYIQAAEEGQQGCEHTQQPPHLPAGADTVNKT